LSDQHNQLNVKIDDPYIGFNLPVPANLKPPLTCNVLQGEKEFKMGEKKERN
jgi:hypothetical protein